MSIFQVHLPRKIVFFCAKPGHNVEAYFTRKANETKINDFKYSGIIDTGSDISLISEKYVLRFSNIIQPCYLKMTLMNEMNIDNALVKLRHSIALIYMDDILIPSQTVEGG